jgi:hypothetical protein
VIWKQDENFVFLTFGIKKFGSISKNLVSQSANEIFPSGYWSLCLSRQCLHNILALSRRSKEEGQVRESLYLISISENYASAIDPLISSKKSSED